MINQIINELADNKQSLVNPFLKAKIFGSRLGNSQLLNWVNKELNGYDSKDDLPDYRLAKANSECNIHQGYYVEYQTPVPLTFIKNMKIRGIFTHFPLDQSVSTLESMEKTPEGNLIGKPFPADFWGAITEEVQGAGFNGNITNIKVFTHKSSVTQTLTVIRSRFLDMMLKLEEEFPSLENEVLEPGQKQKINKQITIIMEQNNFKTTGDANALNFGDQSQVNAAKGENIKQTAKLNNEESKQIEEVLELFKKLLAETEFDEKPDAEIEVLRVENQLKKENPSKNILKSSLETLKNIAQGIVTSALSQPLVENITELIKNWA
jgi:hypothetical protein